MRDSDEDNATSCCEKITTDSSHDMMKVSGVEQSCRGLMMIFPMSILGMSAGFFRLMRARRQAMHKQQPTASAPRKRSAFDIFSKLVFPFVAACVWVWLQRAGAAKWRAKRNKGASFLTMYACERLIRAGAVRCVGQLTGQTWMPTVVGAAHPAEEFF